MNEVSELLSHRLIYWRWTVSNTFLCNSWWQVCVVQGNVVTRTTPQGSHPGCLHLLWPSAPSPPPHSSSSRLITFHGAFLIQNNFIKRISRIPKTFSPFHPRAGNRMMNRTSRKLWFLCAWWSPVQRYFRRPSALSTPFLPSKQQVLFLISYEQRRSFSVRNETLIMRWYYFLCISTICWTVQETYLS